MGNPYGLIPIPETGTGRVKKSNPVTWHNTHTAPSLTVVCSDVQLASISHNDWFRAQGFCAVGECTRGCSIPTHITDALRDEENLIGI